MNIVPSYSFFRNRMWNIRMAVGLLIITMVAMSTYVFAAIGDQADAALKFSSSADRSGAQTLQNKTLAGNVYIFADVGTVASVYFYMDPKVGDLSLIRASSKELYTPYDFGHTIAAGTAKAFDTKRLADGVHRLDVVVTSLNGAKTTHRADFTVKNTVATTTAPTTTKAPVTTVAPPTTKAPVTTAAPAPSNNKNCANLPSACGYPDATNTGPGASKAADGTAHTPVTSFTVVDPTTGPKINWPVGVQYRSDYNFVSVDCMTEGGQHWGAPAGTNIKLEGYDFRVPVTVTSRECTTTFRNNIFRPGGKGQVLRFNRNDKATAVIEWNTFTKSPTATGIAAYSTEHIVAVGADEFDAGSQTIRYNDIGWATTGIHSLYGTINDNYIHDIPDFEGNHLNGYARFGASVNAPYIYILHNTIDGPAAGQTDAIALFQDDGPKTGDHNAVIDGNLIGGGGYTLYAGSVNGYPAGTTSNIKITNNRWHRKWWPNGGSYGPVAYFNAKDAGNVWSNNVWDDTLAPVNP